MKKKIQAANSVRGITQGSPLGIFVLWARMSNPQLGSYPLAIKGFSPFFIFGGEYAI